MSRRRKRKKSKSAGNIKAEGLYNPFPRSGLVKGYEPFIRKKVGEFCKRYPLLNRQEVLFRAVESGLAAEKAFKPELGYDFSTYLRHRLKELHRLHDEGKKANSSSPVHYAKGELEQDRAEERGEEVELRFSGGNGARLTFDLQWSLFELFSDIVYYISSPGPFRVAGEQEEERANYSQAYTNPIPTLKSRHRLAAGVQLGGSDNAPAVHERISSDLPEVIKQQPVGEILKGWTKAVIDHDIRRQREADDEAQKRLAGDHSPTFLEAKPNPIDLRFPGARRPPKYLPLRAAMASLDATISVTDAEGGNEAGSLHEVVGGTEGGPQEVLDEHVETMRWALKELRPSLRKKELPIADRMLDILDGHRSYSQAELAAEMGRSKGQVSKLWHGVAGKVADKIRSRK